VSRDIVAELQRHTAVTTFHIKSFCRRNASLGIEPAALRAAIVSRGGVVIESKLNGDLDVPDLIDRTFCGQWMHLFYAEARTRAPDNSAVASHIGLNGFWFPESTRFDDPLTDVVLDALFDPICRDYQAVAEALSQVPEGARVTVRDLVLMMPGSFFPDVEGALDDLVGRGVLESEEDKYWWKDAPSDLTDYRSACAWVPSSRQHRMVS
jgi:hypothetical protein